MSNDENFKNLIQDFPRQSLIFFAPAECADLPADAKIEFVRQKQPSRELGKGFRILDTPVRVTFPGGERKQFAVALEEETHPRHFSVKRLAKYALDLSEQLKTDRIVPVVIFLRTGEAPEEVILGTEREEYLRFRYVACHLARLPAEKYLDSDNVAAVVNLPNMEHARSKHVAVCLKAFDGLARLEPDPHKQRKYAGYIGQYCGSTDEEEVQFQEEIAREEHAGGNVIVSMFDKREMEGIAKGKADSVLSVLSARGLKASAAERTRIRACTKTAVLDRWLKRAVTADSVGDIFATGPLKH